MVPLAREDNILMHLACSFFSRKHLESLLWLFRANKVDDITPSASRMTALNKVLQPVAGVQTREYDGKIGSRYYGERCGSNLAAATHRRVQRRKRTNPVLGSRLVHSITRPADISDANATLALLRSHLRKHCIEEMEQLEAQQLPVHPLAKKRRQSLTRQLNHYQPVASYYTENKDLFELPNEVETATPSTGPEDDF
ncbi:hypothetical protein CPC08DRAFT_768851 [Agrocybe pediades]|nr:hypothetical protein CPC08DRAFT_768851 [Agrocybe pediades]